MATRVQMGQSLKSLGWKLGLHEDVPYYAVKMPVFSTAKLPGVDSYLGPEMKSTGEAIGIGLSVEQALVKAFGWKDNSLVDMAGTKPVYLSLDAAVSTMSDPLLQLLSSSPVPIVADQETAEALSEKGVSVDDVISISKAREICLDNGLQLICDTKKSFTKDEHDQLRDVALTTGTTCFTSIETLVAFLRAATQVIEAPCPLNDYLDTSRDLNRWKERVG